MPVTREALALISASPNAELLLTPQLTVAASSDPYLRLMGTTRAELIGRPVQQMLAGSPSLLELDRSLHNVLRTAQPEGLRGADFRLSGRSDAPSGDGPMVRLDIDNAPVLAEDGRVKWIIHAVHPSGSASYATPRQASEIALQSAEARLRSVLQTVPDAMIIIDDRGRIESLSSTAEQLFGYAMSEVAGRNVSMFMPSPDREQHDAYLERYLATGERRIIGIGRIVVGLRKDGTTFPMHLTVGEVRTDDRHYFTGFIRDLTEQQLTESRLKELQSEVTHMSRFTALGEMASTLAHEINQPLTAINNYLKGCVRLLQRSDGESSEMLRDALGKAADQALRAGQIIRRLREFVARGDSERRIESLPRLIEDASTLGLIGAKEQGVAVSYRLDPAAELVLADRIQIQQVLVNLIRNAIEVLAEMPGKRQVEIETLACGDGLVQISVADTGSGLAPEVAAHLFQPFVTTKGKGMGLGLSICRTIVEAHGGKIWVEPRRIGGTVFRFTLRAAPDEEE